MIDFEKIERQRTWKTVLKELLVFALPLFFILYGLKCILTLSGKMPVTVMGAVYHSTHLMLVTGFASAMIGLSYIGCGSFLYLSDGQPPNENRTWLWRLGRSISRWGGFLAMLAFWHEANLLRLNSNESFFNFLPNIATSEDRRVILLISIALGIIFVLWFLGAMYHREQVKKNLWGRMCKPLHIWWRPFAYWTPIYLYLSPAGFRVIYADRAGLIHKAYCYTYNNLLGSAFQSPGVKWLKDEVTGQLPLPEVWANSEIIRPKLEEWDATNNLLENPDEPPESPK